MASNDNARRSQRSLGLGARRTGRRTRWLTGFARLLAVFALLGACSDDTDPDYADEAALTVVLPRAPLELDPRLSGDAYGHKISRLLFASLVRIDPITLEPVPDLAASVDALTPSHYRVVLRPGLRFSDGSRLTASDVAATFRSVLDPALGSRYASTYRRIERIEIEDSEHLSFHLDGPHATFLTDLELPVLREEDATAPIARMGGPPPVGAGPYVLEAWRPGQLELASNPHWYAGQPRFPRVRMRVIRDDNTRALRLLAGAGDVALNAVPPLLLPMFVDNPDFAVKTAPGIGTTYIGVNTEAGPLTDVRVRRAISLAIDRERIIATKLGGRATVATTWIPLRHWARDDSLSPPRYDPERARALLGAAGHADGLSLSLRCGSDRFRLSMARVLRAMLKEVGIDVRLRPTETASLISDLGRGHFELTLLQVPEVIEPHVLSWFFGGDRVPGPDREGANRWRFRSRALDAALERGRRHSDRPTRLAAYREVQRILADQLPVIPLWHEDVVAVTSRRAEGFRVPRSGRFDTLAR